MPVVNFKKWNCRVKLSKYSNGRTAIELYDFDTNEPIAIATTNIPQAPLGEDEVMIKDYAENKGVLKALQDAGYIGEVIHEIHKTFVQVQVCKLLIKE